LLKKNHCWVVYYAWTGDSVLLVCTCWCVLDRKKVEVQSAYKRTFTFHFVLMLFDFLTPWICAQVSGLKSVHFFMVHLSICLKWSNFGLTNLMSYNWAIYVNQGAGLPRQGSSSWKSAPCKRQDWWTTMSPGGGLAINGFVS
jgi:phosphatidylglycerophosphate synthase